MALTISDDGLVTKDPSDTEIYEMDWDTEGLPAGVSIETSTFTLTGVSGDTTTTPLTVPVAGTWIGNESRSAYVRLTAGADGSKWHVQNEIVTDEDPTRTRNRGFYVLVQDR
jgi:hypothetical protein